MTDGGGLAASPGAQFGYTRVNYHIPVTRPADGCADRSRCERHPRLHRPTVGHGYPSTACGTCRGAGLCPAKATPSSLLALTGWAANAAEVMTTIRDLGERGSFCGYCAKTSTHPMLRAARWLDISPARRALVGTGQGAPHGSAGCSAGAWTVDWRLEALNDSKKALALGMHVSGESANTIAASSACRGQPSAACWPRPPTSERGGQPFGCRRGPCWLN
ncbi:hypothetical protein BH09ACT8_BH09ACT8_19490 [soil metagenome]